MENTGEQNTKSDYADTLVLGLGVSGLSCARFLHYQDHAFAVADTREAPPGLNELRDEMPDVAVHLGSMNDIASQSLKRLIVSPGISVKEPFIVAAKQNGVEVFGDIELFARNVDAPVVAIAGSNGKSTVTTLLGEMAKAAGLKVKVGGNLGTPALQLLQQSLQQRNQIANDSAATDYYILELSSFQLETTASLNAVAAVVLNVSADHMDRYDSFADYAEAKQRVYQGNGVMVTNADDDTVVAMEQVFLQAQPQRRVVRFTLQTPQQHEFGILEHQGEDWLAFGDKELLPVKELRIAGRHNQANALAALALGDVMRIPMQVMLTVLRDFAGLPHRTQWVAEIDGVNWYNDSKGTNVGATVSAVAGLPGQKVLIAGGIGKDADFAPLQKAVEMYEVKAVVLMGHDAATIASALNNCVPVVFADDMQAAVLQAKQLATPGDNVLLSPACASFDMFANFAERGDVFMRAVKGLSRQ